MFFSSLSTLETDKRVLPPSLVKGLEYLASKNFSAIAQGRYDIDGNDMFALVQEYTTVPKNEKKAEFHERYIDVQFVCSGSEIIGFAPAGTRADVHENCLSDKDAITFTHVSNETDLILTNGMYVVLYPGEIHRPQCACNAPVLVKKVVLKVAMAAIR
jgi:YhcH/YjgK/YiaL family protein